MIWLQTAINITVVVNIHFALARIKRIERATFN